MDDGLMRIGEIAAFFGVSVKAMRVYERMGILKPVKVDEKNNYRYYSAEQVTQLDALLELRELGFSLTEIRDLLCADGSKERYMELLAHKKAMWQDKAAHAQDRVNAVNEAIARLEASKPPVKLHELTEDERAELLGKMVCVDQGLHERIFARSLLSEALWL